MSSRWRWHIVVKSLVCSTVLFVQVQSVFAWSVPTHQLISDRAAHVAVINTGFLHVLGFSNPGLKPDDVDGIILTDKSISGWIQQGANFEDAGNIFTGRFYNHFHNPLCQAPWTSCQPPWPDAGLHDSILLIPFNGESALLWAQNAGLSDQTNTDWSWQAVREDYYSALTATTKTDRESWFAKTFEGVGHIIHLIQDMSQPAHVRNDAHPVDGAGIGNGLEAWAISHDGSNAINSIIVQSPVIPPLPQGPSPASNLAPITAFWDNEQYDGTLNTLATVSNPDIGLAEYTNANYFSEDTINAPAGDRHHFDFPSTQINDYTTCADTAPPGSQGQFRWYLGRTAKMGSDCPIDPSTMDHALAGSFLPSPAPEQVSSSLQLDAKVHEEYSRDLIPRAVGYSVGLINYFFRGQIELSLPGRGYYAISDGNGDFTNFRVKAKNVSPPNVANTPRDEMTNGTIQLVIKYNLAKSDPFRPVWVDVNPTEYIVVSESTESTITSDDTGTELDFDLSQNPLPLWATNVYAYVVYRGVLGDEQDAVAVGYKDVSEPTPFTMANGMDYVCLNGAWYVAGSNEALQEVDSNHNGIADEADIYPHGITDGYLRFSDVNNPIIGYAYDYNAWWHHDTNPQSDGVAPAQYGKVFVITDGTAYSAGESATRTNLDSRDTIFPPLSSIGYITLNPVKRQSEWVNGVWTDIYLAFPQWRGVYGWPIWTWFNDVYGTGTCLTDDLSGTAPDLTGPVPVTLQ
jgi:hypothetical protein